MAKSPKNTQGPIVETGPTREQNRSWKNDGRWRAKRSDAGKARESSAIEKPNLARWFWGSFIFMATLSVTLSAMALFQQGEKTRIPVANENTPAENGSIEVSASDLINGLGVANRFAADKVRLQIGPMLEAAYQPVYNAIPIYADYHYSVWGEYAELGTAAIGDVGARMEEILFKGHEARIENVAVQLDELYSSTFQAAIAEEFTKIESSGEILGSLTVTALNDAQRRMLITVPVGAAAITGTTAIASIIAQQIAAKIAAKAALKVGGKWAAVGTTAGTAGALCSWSGPAAGLCAAAGGISAWLGADYGIIKIDEFWNREDFESELREMITEQKLEHQVALENAITARAIALQEMTDEIGERHDFTLRELYGEGNAEICRVATELVSRYDRMRDSLGERTPEALVALRAQAAQEVENLSIGRLAREIILNLDDASQITVASVRIRGILPNEQRANRDVSGRLIINGNSIELPRSSPNEAYGFAFDLSPEASIRSEGFIDYAIFLEQHLRILDNRFFGAQGRTNITAIVEETDGLEHWINLRVQIAYDERARSLEEVSMSSVIGQPLFLNVRLRALPLPAIQNLPNCQ